MKIKTITCHNVYNYGASLQAFALQHYLAQAGHEVEIIDYRPWYSCGAYKIFSVSKNTWTYSATRWCPPLRYLAAPIRNRVWLRTYGRKKAFDNFTKGFLKLTPELYHDHDSLMANPPEADCYIAGSDQIWNTDMDNGNDLSFFLDFGDEGIKRISYAASFGVSEINPELSEDIKKRLSKFDAISVREKTGLDILKRMGIEKAVQVVDPVFLLSKEQWMSEVDGKARQYGYKKDKYILLYDFINDSKIAGFAKKCASIYGLPIIAINDLRKNTCANRNITDAGPLEFISLIANAAIVISNSFHATAFSCIFEKDFYTFSLSTQRNSSRMTDLLTIIDSIDRFNPAEPVKTGSNFKSLQQKIEESRRFLQKMESL